MSEVIDLEPPTESAGNATSSNSVDDDKPTGSGKLAVAVLLAIIIGMWLLAFTGFGKGEEPGRLKSSPATIEQIRQRCQQLQDEINDLPNASSTPTTEQRVVVVDQANGYIAAFIVDLKTIQPDVLEDEELMTMWVDDWNSFLSSRQAYADKLRAGDESARFSVDLADGKALDARMDSFAFVNQFDECSAPDDV